ncbi:acyl carrier protein [Nocardia pseudobrasiliensis]|uniref:Acyl carrier protein n=1 Tax=Nocardia pseudobrasiliensis TaxID=45979 RepID=A0A370ICI2_9NOCA|nr:phosphopantetheine-binding protein [Nocardia pseudobrasiliensis]RDI68310.1 hypothetical protein DFR76_102711 [Nocardia pseudobrasiliensis]
MSDTMSRTAAEDLVRESLAGFADADELAALPGDQALRTALELDSIDFLTFVERLSTGSGKRIDEADYPQLRTVDDCVEFLTARPR